MAHQGNHIVRAVMPSSGRLLEIRFLTLMDAKDIARAFQYVGFEHIEIIHEKEEKVSWV